MQFMLAKNYRSHQGILSVASWVMQLLWSGENVIILGFFSRFTNSRDNTGFPETIDKLDPEIGQTGGPKPIIFGT